LSGPRECPRQPAVLWPSARGRSGQGRYRPMVGWSSFCGDPVTVRESASLWRRSRVELTCMRNLSGIARDTDEAEPKAQWSKRTNCYEEEEGPTYFVDISPSWKSLVGGSVGVDRGWVHREQFVQRCSARS
jgi:hypothetical protein